MFASFVGQLELSIGTSVLQVVFSLCNVLVLVENDYGVHQVMLHHLLILHDSLRAWSHPFPISYIKIKV